MVVCHAHKEARYMRRKLNGGQRESLRSIADGDSQDPPRQLSSAIQSYMRETTHQRGKLKATSSHIQVIQTYIRTEILGIYGAPNYRNTRKAYNKLEKQ